MSLVDTSTGETRSNVELLNVEVAGEKLQLHHAGILLWPEYGTLAVADLHLEKASAYARRGTFLPPYDTLATLKRLQELITLYNPKCVIAVGDSFHDPDAGERIPEAYLELLSQLQAGRDWHWIAGNHDRTMSDAIGGNRVPDVKLGRLTFRHEPVSGKVVGEIAAHLHPCARIRRAGGTVRRFCFAADEYRLIMPAFGALTGGLNVLDPAWSPFFNDTGFKVHILGMDRIYTLASSKLAPD